MKLSRLYKQYSIIALLVVVLIGSVFQYLIFKNSMNLSADDNLDELKHSLIKYVERNDAFMTAGELGVKNGRLKYMLVSSSDFETYHEDTVIWSEKAKKFRDFRIINFPVRIKNQPYKVSISLRTMGHEDLITSTFFSFICVFFLLLLYILLISHFFTKNIWDPFRLFLNELKTTDISKQNTFSFSRTNIDEINELEKAYSRMMKRIQNDYRKTKELSENITHELQTPLTILRSKVDHLQQIYEQDEHTMAILQSLQNNINRVSYFNRSLMLLTRINNDQYCEFALFDFSVIIREKTDDYIEIIHAKNITLSINQSGSFIHEINPTLLDLMINNIITNAVKYNRSRSGYITITINADEIVFENPYEGSLPNGNLFERFKKDKKQKDSTGLGLSIVEAICKKFHLKIAIEATDQKFRIILSRS